MSPFLNSVYKPLTGVLELWSIIISEDPLITSLKISTILPDLLVVSFSKRSLIVEFSGNSTISSTVPALSANHSRYLTMILRTYTYFFSSRALVISNSSLHSSSLMFLYLSTRIFLLSLFFMK